MSEPLVSGRILPAIVLALIALPAAAQDATASDGSSPAPAQMRLPPDALPGDIVVRGYRDRKARDTRTTIPGSAGYRPSTNQRKYDLSERLAKCAARSRLSNLDWMRGVVDGEVNSARHHRNQDRLVRAYITCGESPSLLSYTRPPQYASDIGSIAAASETMSIAAGNSGSVEASPLGWSIFDRGAFTIAVLKRFAPDLTLSRAEMADPAVQSRFNLREVPRNRLRFPVDYKYFQVAVCMVRVEPEMAVRLAMSDGEARFSDVQEVLIDRARICVGNAKKVQVDPTEFRLYIADAVYRWAVAARNVGSLIPSDAQLAEAN